MENQCFYSHLLENCLRKKLYFRKPSFSKIHVIKYNPKIAFGWTIWKVGFCVYGVSLIENMSCFFLSSSFENGKSVGSQKKQLSQNAIPQKKQPFLSFHVAPLKKHAFWLRFQSVFRFEGLFQKCLWRFTKRRQMNTVAVWTDQICASFTNYFKPVNGVILFYSIYIEI